MIDFYFSTQHKSKLFSVLLLGSIVIGTVLFSYYQNNFSFIYPVDDAYIHMAISKNLTNHYTFGVTAHEFSATSSSLLYTVILSLTFKLFGTQETTPLILNLIFGIILIIALLDLFKKEKVRVTISNLSLLSIIFFTPIPALIISGMEHTLQILINILFINNVSLLIIHRNKYSVKSKDFIITALLAFLTTGIRYEGVFIIFVAMLLLAIRKKWKEAFLIGMCSIIPIVLFGLVSIKNGSFFFPNSLLAKGSHPDLSIISIANFSLNWLESLFKVGNLHLLSCFIVLVGTLILQKGQKLFWDKKKVFVIITISTMILHLSFAKTGWFFRYEAYLVSLSLVSITLNITCLYPVYEKIKNSTILALITILFVLTLIYPLGRRSAASLYHSYKAPKNIYEQQYQMASFIKLFYPNSTIVANDIGAICFFNDIRLIDLAGLGSVEILKNSHLNFQKFIYEFSKNKSAEIAIFYDEIFPPPIGWEKVGEWIIEDNVICAKPKVSFYSVTPEKKHILLNNLKQYQSKLPNTIQIIYY